MRSVTFLFVLIAASLAACSNVGGLGATCESRSECESDLQCVSGTCVAKCERATQCGDGFSCNEDGLCVAARAGEGSSCGAEGQCSAGLACVLDSDDRDNDGILSASCAPDHGGHSAGDLCTSDADCRNGTCALGLCVDLCTEQRDCAPSMTCSRLPRVEANGASFLGCLPEQGLIKWEIPVPAPEADVLVPVPDHARSMSMTMTVGDDAQRVGAKLLVSPRRTELFNSENPLLANPVRHVPLPRMSVLQIPSSAAAAIEPGAYHLSLRSLRGNGEVGSATPRLRVAVRVGDKSRLDLHFYFLNFQEYPCSSQFPDGNLSASSQSSPEFKGYLDQLRGIFAGAGVALGKITFDDLPNTALDNVTSENMRELLALPLDSAGRSYRGGINVFLVRSLSPSAVLAAGPTPGTMNVEGASGVIISMQALCFQSWTTLARTTAHQLARYMGLYPTRDLAGVPDPIEDTDSSADNLMFFAERGRTFITAGQRAVLTTSPAIDGDPP
jgi:hypothetical protein